MKTLPRIEKSVAILFPHRNPMRIFFARALWAAALAGAIRVAAQDQTVNGNLTVTGQTSLTTLIASGGTITGGSGGLTLTASSSPGQYVVLQHGNGAAVQVNSATTAYLDFNAGSAYNAIISRSGQNYIRLTNTGGLELFSNGTNQNITLTPNGTGATVFNGNVGIGTTTPNQKLTIKGSVSIENATMVNNGVGSSDLALSYGSAFRFANDVNNNTMPMLTLGTYDGKANTLRIGTDAWPSQITFRTGDLYSSISGGQRMIIDNAGNVGIGTTNPAQKLDVAGNANISGNLTIGGSFSVPSYVASSGSITGGTSGLALNAGGTDQSVTLIPSGSGRVSFGGAATSINAGKLLWAEPTNLSAGQSRLAITNSTDASVGAYQFSTDTGTTAFLGIGSRKIATSATGAIDSTLSRLALNATGSDGSTWSIGAAIDLMNRKGSDWGNANQTASALSFKVGRISSGGLIETMRLSETGDVGIGTASPGALLDVNGSFRLNRPQALVDSANTIGVVTGTNSAQGLAFAPTDFSATNAAYFRLVFPDANTVRFGTDYDGNVWSSGAKFRDIQFGRANGTPYLSIIDTGNVGIGTANPQSKLVVQGTTIDTQISFSPATDVGGYLFSYGPSNAAIFGGAKYNGSFLARNTAASGIVFGYGAIGDINFLGDTGLTAGNTFTPTSRMYISPAGNIGIGMTSPAQKLDVAGNANFAGTIASDTGTGENIMTLRGGAGGADGATYVDIQNSSAPTGFRNWRMGADSGHIGGFGFWRRADDNATALDQYFRIDTVGMFTFHTRVLAENPTPSTSTSTGAMVVTGGAGIGGNLNVGGNLTIGGTFSPGTLAASGQVSGDSFRADNGNFLVAGGFGTHTLTLNSGSGTPVTVNAAGTGYASGHLLTLSSDTVNGSNNFIRFRAGMASTPIDFGNIRFDGASGLAINSGGALALSAGGTNQNVTTAPSGIGEMIVSNATTGVPRRMVTLRYNASGAGPEIASLGFGMSTAAEAAAAKAGLGFERTQTNGRGWLHFYNNVANDTSGYAGQAGASGSGPAVGDIKGSISANGNWLFGTVTDSANGRLQLATHSGVDGGIGFGADTSLYRSYNGQLMLQSSATQPALLIRSSAFTTLGGIRIAGGGGELLQIGGGYAGSTALSEVQIGPGSTSVTELSVSSSRVLVAQSTASNSSSSGALVVNGGAGIGGNLNVGGALNAASLSVGGVAFGNPSDYVKATGGSALTVTSLTASNGTIIGSASAGLSLSAGAANKNITLTPTGTGSTIFDGRVMTENYGSAMGELFAGNTQGGPQLDRAVRIGQSRTQNYDDALISRNLGPVAGADTYQTYANAAFGGLEFKYAGAGVQDIYLYASGAAQASSTPFIPAPRMVVKGASGNVGIGTTNPSRKLSVLASGDNDGISIDQAGRAALTINGSHGRALAFSADQDSVNKGIIEYASGNRGIVLDSNSSPEHIELWANNIQTAIITNGNVGIGTTPSAKLDVAGTVNVNAGATNNYSLQLSTTQNGGTVTTNGGNLYLLSNSGRTNFSTGGIANEIAIYNVGNQAVELNSNGNSYFNGGNVGIGTAAPGMLLDVFGVNQRMRIGDGTAMLVSGQWDGVTNRIESSGRPLRITTYTGALDLGHSGNPELTVASGGNVGIGTTNPGAKLEVAGTTLISGLFTATNGAQINGTTNLQTATIAGASSFGGAMNFLYTGGTPPTTSTAGTLGWGTTATSSLNLSAGSGRGMFLGVDGSTTKGVAIDSSGNVGIGTATPSEKLEIQKGNLLLRDSTFDGASQGGGWIKGFDDHHSIYFREGSTDNTNYYEYGGTLAAGKGHRFFTGGLKAGQALRLQIADDGSYFTGNVGIGTNAPDAKLSIVGDEHVTGNVTISQSLAVNTSGDPNSALTIGSAVNGGTGGNLRLLSGGNSWGIENVSGTLKFYRETATGANKQESASMNMDASVQFGGRVTSLGGLTVTSGGISVSAGDVTLSNGSVHGVAMPTNPTGTDAANVTYVNGQIPFNWSSTAITLKRSTDYLGLGTAMPGYKLDVFDSNGAQLDNLGLGKGLQLRRDATGSNQAWLLGVGATDQFSTVGSAFKIADTTANADRLVINSSGNVGLGTITPQARMHLYAPNNAASAGAQLIISAPQSYGDPTGNYILFRNNWSTNNGTAGFASIGFNDAGLGDGKLWFATAAQNPGVQSNTPTKRMIIDGTGHVGIGVTDAYFNYGSHPNNAAYKLSVAGKVHAQEVVVDNSDWADYVFDENYRNAPLSEVEQHIKEYKHLPGVPSAQEVAEKGVNVGQMQAVLLQKVEELTLHMIEQEKRIKRLEDENAALRANAQSGQ